LQNEHLTAAQRESEATTELNDLAAEFSQAALEALGAEDILGHIPIAKTALAV
jgi:hypothetical protein